MGSKLIDRFSDRTEFALLVVTLALNRAYHFGRDRLKAAEAECSRIVGEEFGRDMELAGARLRRAVDRIMAGSANE